MTTNYHTPYQDEVTHFSAAEMNPPLASLDSQITANVSAISGKAATSHTHDDRYFTETELAGATTVGVSIGYQSGDKPAAAAEISCILPSGVTFPANLTGSAYFANTGPTAEAVVSIRKNGTQFATMTVAAGGTTSATWAGTETAFAAGDRLSFVFPAQDATWAGVSIMVKGVRS